MEDYKLINRELEIKYGKTLDGRPKYRIIMNERGLIEKRFHNGQFYDVPKYSYIPEGVWILEMFMEYDNPELIQRQSYEPLWTFLDAFNEPVRPNLRACILLVESSLRSATVVMSEDEQREKEELESYETLGGNAGIADKIGAHEGVTVQADKSIFKES